MEPCPQPPYMAAASRARPCIKTRTLEPRSPPPCLPRPRFPRCCTHSCSPYVGRPGRALGTLGGALLTRLGPLRKRFLPRADAEYREAGRFEAA